MIHLVEEPLVREPFFPSSVQHYAIETARPEDGAAIQAIAARHEPAEHVALLRACWEQLPGAFCVARSPRGEVVAFTILSELGDVPRRLLARDPLCEPWRVHLGAHPVPAGGRVLLARCALAWATGAAPSPCFAALLRDLERASLEAAPALRRVYTEASGDVLLAQLAPLGYLPIRDCGDVQLGGVAYRPLVCDLGPESLTGWLSALAARDLPVESTALHADARELVLDGRRIAHTRLECDVLNYLRERENRTVAREALLRDVWGYEWTGGSNVVEVAVSGLRRKLGERADALETVRGRRLSAARTLRRAVPSNRFAAPEVGYRPPVVSRSVGEGDRIRRFGMTVAQLPSGAVRVAPRGELDLERAYTFDEELRRVEATEPPCIVLDLWELSFVDSAGLGRLLAAQRRARRAGRRLLLLRVEGAIQRLLALTALDSLFEIIADPAEIDLGA